MSKRIKVFIFYCMLESNLNPEQFKNIKSEKSEQTINDNPLVRARKDKKISLEELSKLSNINLNYLQALENEEWKNLPSNPYVRSFLMKLSQFLDLEESATIDYFNRKMEAVKPTQSFNKKPYQKTHIIDLMPSKASIVLVSVMLLMVIVLAGIQALEHKKNQEFLISSQYLLQQSIDSSQFNTLSPNTNQVNQNTKLNKLSSSNQVVSDQYLVLTCIRDSTWVTVNTDKNKNISQKLLFNDSLIVSFKDTLAGLSGVANTLRALYNDKEIAIQKRFLITNHTFTTR